LLIFVSTIVADLAAAEARAAAQAAAQAAAERAAGTMLALLLLVCPAEIACSCSLLIVVSSIVADLAAAEVAARVAVHAAEGAEVKGARAVPSQEVHAVPSPPGPAGGEQTIDATLTEALTADLAEKEALAEGGNIFFISQEFFFSHPLSFPVRV
jgi:hypothetical protein